MAEREKVMKALKCRVTDRVVECGNCLYNDSAGDWRQRCDFHRLCADALALLREQEPRVLTVEEIRSGAVEVAWIEDADKAEVIPGIWFRLSNEGEDEAVDIHIRDGFVGARLEVYGKMWRAWTSRPSPDQMRDTKWEESDEKPV